MDTRLNTESKTQEQNQADIAKLFAKVAELEAKLEQTSKLSLLKVAAHHLIRELDQRILSIRFINANRYEINYRYCDDFRRYQERLEKIEAMKEHESVSYETFLFLKYFRDESREKWLPRDDVLKQHAEKIITLEKERNPSKMNEHEVRFHAEYEKEKEEQAKRARLEVAEREARERTRQAEEKERAEVASTAKKKQQWWSR